MNLFWRRSIYVPTAPIKVAILPKIMSGRIAPPRMFPIRHPTNSPGIAAGVNNGKIVRASEIRIFISPNENGAKI